jgi:kexin
MAAGVIALVLQERPDLTWRDVKHIIAKGAVPIDVGNTAHPGGGGGGGVVSDWHTNAAGYRHSYRYGFGLLSVPSILAISRTHTPVPVPFKAFRSGVTTMGTNNRGLGMIPYTVNYTIPSASAAGGTHPGRLQFIEHVMLYVAITHEQRGNIRITLKSHATGTTSILAPERPNDRTANYPWGGWTFTTVRHWGEPLVPGSVWSIAVDDTNPRTRGRGHLNAYELIVHGY